MKNKAPKTSPAYLRLVHAIPIKGQGRDESLSTEELAEQLNDQLMQHEQQLMDTGADMESVLRDARVLELKREFAQEGASQEEIAESFLLGATMVGHDPSDSVRTTWTAFFSNAMSMWRAYRETVQKKTRTNGQN